MLITLSYRTAICQSVAEVKLTGVGPFGAVSHRFNFISFYSKRRIIHIKLKIELNLQLLRRIPIIITYAAY
jgi:hypothetical protein